MHRPIDGYAPPPPAKRVIWLWFFCVCMATLIGVVILGASWATPVLAETSSQISQPAPAPDTACRGCHGDNQREIVLPSGEAVKLLVSLAHLDSSVHTRNAETPVNCTSCHTGVLRYRYPHQPNPAQSLTEFSGGASAVCVDCHYPHNPSHEIQDPVEGDGVAGLLDKEGLPACTDCHGNHEVAPVDQIDEIMPGACVTCHADQPEEWAAAFLAPRPGLGQGADGYVGSERCMGCHADRYLTWRETLHATTIQRVADAPQAVVADFAVDDPDRTFDLAQVALTIGGRWQQRFITQTVSGDLLVLPGHWNVATQEWVADHAAEGAGEGETVPLVNWVESCSFCHVTGLEIADPAPMLDAAGVAMTDTLVSATAGWSFQEFGIGCEDCHGAGAEHVADPATVKPYNQADDQVCGACHSRGSSPEGHPFPATYKPGDTLTDHFTLTTDAPTRWPDGSARIHNQQYADWMLGNTMQESGEIQCATCHAVHGAGQGPSQLVEPTNQLCASCHVEKLALANHIPYHEQAMKKRDFACNDCHMPMMATVAVDYDIHSHTFQQPNPQGTLDHGGLAAMPNGCNQCHKNLSETPEWAATTISWALDKYVIRSTSPFGPGPTPASPPVPTPLPSAGEQHEVSAYVDFAWVWPLFYGVLALVAVIGAALVARFVWLRRKSHVG